MSDSDRTLEILLAFAKGDAWLSADACAAHLGMFTPKGKINRRGFLDRVASRGSFPKPLVIGNEKKWKKSEVAQWAEDERRIAARIS
ncbi:MAG TPA: hypothetical protein VEY92_13190 [Pseudoxanthomonas sp.]|nr:hypothetical protein [Pseudoxanthomonas sp.]